MTSSIGAEVSLVSTWVQGICTTNAGITGQAGTRTFDHLAPALTEYPYVVHQLQSSIDLYGLGPNRILVDCEVVIRGIARCTSYDPLKPLAAAIDAAFDGAAGVLSDGVVIGVRRTRPYTQIEEYEDGQIRHLGGIYRVLAQGT